MSEKETLANAGQLDIRKHPSYLSARWMLSARFAPRLMFCPRVVKLPYPFTDPIMIPETKYFWMNG